MTGRPFQSRLAPIRTLRKDAEQTVMRELAGELAAAESLRDAFLSIEERIEVARKQAHGPTTVHDLVTRQNYAERLEMDRAELLAQLSQQEENVAYTRSRLAAAMREREKVDRLDDRRRETHDLANRRVEASESDELALLSHLRSEAV